MKRLAMLMVAAVCAAGTVQAGQNDMQRANEATKTSADTGAGKQDLAQLLKPFPAAEPAYVRWVIDLPALPDENSRKVELLPG